MTLAPGAKLGPYEILAPIGSGGMGEVWKGLDTRLGRIVAIKKVKEQHSERFKRETRSIAALNHPNICQLFDIGPDYLVLEYVDGKPLSSPLPEKEAVRLAIQIATALEEAHQKGIIHRDLKPSNIMVTDRGSVKLLDFGLAKLYEQDTATSTSPTADMPATQAGAVLGTVAYMSPEQAQGQPVDARSDIFSFGLVLYEMLIGRRAFTGESTPEVMTALLRDEPPALKASPSVEKIVRQCLAKQPSGRYQRMSEVRTALEQVFGEKATVIATEPQPSIAVLPFTDMSPGKDNEWFGDGLAEEIINALTKISGLKVIARTSAFAFKGKQEDVRRIAEALSVTSILEGSVRKAGNRIRITAQLITAADGSHLWSERYDREMNDVFAIQDEISQAIAEKLRVGLSGDRALIKRHTENVEAYNLYLKGRYHFFTFTAEGLAKSLENYRGATELDPDYALAWSGLSETYWQLGRQGYMPPREANEQCQQSALQALELDEMLPEAHSMMAALRVSEFDWKGAEGEYHRALELDSKSEQALTSYTHYYLLPMQRFEEAVAASRKVLAQNPLSPINHAVLGLMYFFLGQSDRGIEQIRHALEIDHNYYIAHFYLGISYVRVSKFDEGIRALEAASQLSDRSPYVQGYLGAAFAGIGRIGEAQKILEELLELAKRTYVPPSSFALLYAALGEIENGFNWLEKAVDERDSRIIYLLLMPSFPLRSHPRYHALLRKMNLEAS
jgi:eukaryotic-like serine/threonine-protein kinase